MAPERGAGGRFVSGGGSGGGSSGGGGGGTTLETLSVRLTANAAGFNRVIADMEKRAEAAVKKMESFGKKLSGAITLPLAGVGAFGVKAFSDFESAFTKSTAVMTGLSEDQKNAMAKAAEELALRTSTSVDKIAETYYFLASAGLSAEQQIAALPKVQQFAAAGAFDMARATEMLYDAQAGLGMKSSDAAANAANTQRIADVLMKATTTGQASTEQFAESLAKVSSSLRQMKTPVEEGVGVLAVFAESGKKGAEAATFYEITLRELQRASRDQSDVWQAAGLSVYDAQGKFRNMADIIKQLEDRIGSMSDEARGVELEKLGFAGESTKAILPLIGNSAKIREFQGILEKAGGTAGDVAGKQAATFAGQLKILWNSIDITAGKIGEKLIPYLKAMFGPLKTGLAWFRGLSDQAKEFFVTAGIVAASIGPLILLIGKLTSIGIGVFLKPIGAILGTIIPLLGTVAGMLFSWPALLAAVGIGWLTLTGSGKDFTDWVGSKLAPFLDIVGTAFSGIKASIQAGDFAGAFEIAWLGVETVFYTAMDKIMRRWGDWVTNIVEVFHGVVTEIGAAWVKMAAGLEKGMMYLAEKSPAMRKFFFGSDTAKALSGAEMKRKTVGQQTAILGNDKTFTNDLEWSQQQFSTLGYDKGLEAIQKRVAEDPSFEYKMPTIFEGMMEKAGGDVDRFQAMMGDEVTRMKAVIVNAEKELARVSAMTEAEYENEVFSKMYKGIEEDANRSGKEWQEKQKARLEKFNTTNWAAEKQSRLDELNKKSFYAQAAVAGDAMESATMFEKEMETLSAEMAKPAVAAEKMNTSLDKTKDLLKEPMIARFGVDGVDALEAGTAKAFWALQSYKTGPMRGLKETHDNAKLAADAAQMQQRFDLANTRANDATGMNRSVELAGNQNRANADAAGIDNTDRTDWGKETVPLLQQIRDALTADKPRNQIVKLLPAEIEG